MAEAASARETLFALRREIARLEGRPAERLVVAQHSDMDCAVTSSSSIRTGVPQLDSRLNGGVPAAALTEIVGTRMHDTGAVTGFALGLASLALRQNAAAAPLFWVGTEDCFREGGFPYAPALLADYGIAPDQIILSQARKTEDALWMAGEFAGLKSAGALIIEMRGNPAKLDLTVTRRLQRRASLAGHPVFLVRQSAVSEPTAAPVRFLLSSAPADLRRIVSGPLAGSIGPPAFQVWIDKNRNGLSGQFLLEWNPAAHSFHERPTGHVAENNGIVVSPSRNRPDPAPPAGAVMALREAAGGTSSRDQSPGRQYEAHRGSRRTG